MIRIDFLLLTRANSNSNLQVGIGRLRERVCRRGDGRAHSPASRVLDGIGLIRGGNVPDLLAKPLENSARPGDIRDARIRSNGARLFRPRNISSLYSLVYLPLLPFSFPFPSLPFPSFSILFYLSSVRSKDIARQRPASNRSKSSPTRCFTVVSLRRQRNASTHFRARARIAHIERNERGTANDKDRSAALRLPPTYLYPTDLFIPANILDAGISSGYAGRPILPYFSPLFDSLLAIRTDTLWTGDENSRV